MRLRVKAILGNVWIATILVILSLSLENVRAEDIRDASNNFTFRYNTEGSRYKDYLFDFSYRQRIGNSQWFITQKFFSITFVNEKSVTGLYSMQGAVLLTTSTISSIFSGNSIWSRKNVTSPLNTILSIPSSQIEYGISKSTHIGLSNNTEYILYRGHSGERGIFYTPALTINSWSGKGYEAADAFAIQLQLGRTYFWDFDGQSSWIGWTVGGTIVFAYY